MKLAPGSISSRMAGYAGKEIWREFMAENPGMEKLSSPRCVKNKSEVISSLLDLFYLLNI